MPTFHRLNKKLFRQIFRRSVGMTLMVLVSVPMFSSDELPAGFSSQVSRTKVVIGDKDYGYFDGLVGMEKFVEQPEGTHTTIVLQRDFVTDQSLYVWAKRNVHRRLNLRNIHLVLENADGEPISQFILEYCQPLSWSVEVANPSQGGFHEKIVLAVRKVSSL